VTAHSADGLDTGRSARGRHRGGVRRRAVAPLDAFRRGM